MIDIKLNETTWDIEIDSSGDFVTIDGVEALRQRLRIKLQHVRGEWFANQQLGIISLSIFGDKNPDVEAIASYLRTEIEDDHEVITVQHITADIHAETRTLYINFIASTIYGNITQRAEKIL